MVVITHAIKGEEIKKKKTSKIEKNAYSYKSLPHHYPKYIRKDR